MDSKTTRCDIWSHFERHTAAANKNRCKICKDLLTISGSSPFTLKRHFSKKHPTTFVSQPVNSASSSKSIQPNLNAGGGKQIQKSVSDYVDVFKPLSAASKSNIDEQLLKIFCNHALPFYLLEAEDFKELFRTICPSYVLPNRKTFSNAMLNKQYDNVLDKVKTDLKYSKAVCLTSDGWTGLNGTNFLAATVHFVNDSTNLKSYLLECEEFTERHTSENIALWLKSVMDRFAILDKVAVV